MTCPPEVAKIVAEVLQTGILRARSAGWAGDGRRCAVEADHVHNLPALLTDFAPEMLRYYWDVERPAFVKQCEGKGVEQFGDLWDRLAPHVGAVAALR